MFGVNPDTSGSGMPTLSNHISGQLAWRYADRFESENRHNQHAVTNL
jgi:hypothetical protein